MELTVVDAFTDKPYAGNPAAVALVDGFPPDDRMQDIAREMNLSETAFVVERSVSPHDLRWFTPATEVGLCGHATLAAAHVLGGRCEFQTRSGVLTSESIDGWIYLDFPAWRPIETALPEVPAALGTYVWAGIAGDDWIVELPFAQDVFDFVADQTAIARLGRRGLIITARAPDDAGYDVVSRVFGPNVGITEDPVTGSAHCALAPYWATRLERDVLTGFQASRRGGIVRMRLKGERVELGGQAVTVSRVNLIA